jgi:hypothetical protein
MDYARFQPLINGALVTPATATAPGAQSATDVANKDLARRMLDDILSWDVGATAYQYDTSLIWDCEYLIGANQPPFGTVTITGNGAITKDSASHVKFFGTTGYGSVSVANVAAGLAANPWWLSARVKSVADGGLWGGFGVVDTSGNTRSLGFMIQTAAPTKIKIIEQSGIPAGGATGTDFLTTDANPHILEMRYLSAVRGVEARLDRGTWNQVSYTPSTGTTTDFWITSFGSTWVYDWVAFVPKLTRT